MDNLLQRALTGAVEFHVHFDPDGLTPRKNDVFQLVREAKSIGMRAIVLKNKSCGTGAIAHLANKYANGALAIGAVTMDLSMGGFNVEAVSIEANLGSKVVWMPTYSARNDPSRKRTDWERENYNLTVLDARGNVLPEVLEVLQIIKQNEMVLATGHISKDEIYALMDAAQEVGVKKIVIDHPLMHHVGTLLDIEDQVALSKRGAFIEHCWVGTTRNSANIPVDEMVNAIRAVGVEKCILASDFGQIHNTTPTEGFLMMVRTLFELEFRLNEIEYMVKENPSSLLGI